MADKSAPAFAPIRAGCRLGIRSLRGTLRLALVRQSTAFVALILTVAHARHSAFECHVTDLTM
jgi:hypothetical protein